MRCPHCQKESELKTSTKLVKPKGNPGTSTKSKARGKSKEEVKK